MDVGIELRERVGRWDDLSRWERSELGKELRWRGLSYGEIMDLIPVKKSTLATWCREVDLTQDQIEAIRVRRAPLPGIPRDTNWKRREEIALIKQIAREQVPELLGDTFWIAGLIMYWAEGAKTRNFVSMANTDPRVLRLFVRWICTYVDPTAQFSLHLHLHEGNDEAAARRYWRGETELEHANFHKTFIKPKGTGHRKNHLQHGICTVKVRRAADPWNIIMEWIDSVAQHFCVDSANE